MNDLLLGARLMFVGGRPGWTRTVMTALGVGIGVALLLLAAAVPAALQARAARAGARFTSPPQGQFWSVGNTVLMKSVDTQFHGRAVRGYLVRAGGPAAPVPPGLAVLPADGELAVSPALRALLDSPEGALLVPRFGGARVVATIDDQGLSGPSELAFYRGSGTLTAETANLVGSFGNAGSVRPYPAMLVLLVVLAFVVLLLPFAVFLGAAVRFGGDSRDRRLAALRLVGADGGMARRIATGEAVLGAVLGIAVGAVLFALGRQVAPLLTVADISVFATDIRPYPVLVLVIVAAVPTLAVAVTLSALRGIVIEPLGVTRRSVPVRRRLWWRLILPLAGIALLYSFAGELDGMRSDRLYYQVALGATLLLVGVVTLLPWLIDQAVRRLRGGPVCWQLAVRRLQVDNATSARLVSGMAVAVAGTVGLQMLFATVQDRFTASTAWQGSQNVAYVEVERVTNGSTTLKRLRDIPGVARSTATLITMAEARGPVGASGQDQSASETQGLELRIGDCAALTDLVTVDRCADRDVFVIPPGTQQTSAGTRVGAGTRLSLDDGRLVWTIPPGARPVNARDSDRMNLPTVLATPGAIDAGRVGPLSARIVAVLDPQTPDGVEHLRNAAALIDPAATVVVPSSVTEDRNFTNVRRGLYVGVVVTLLLMGLSLLVAVLEQLRERRRLLATLLAIGTPRRTLTWSLLCQLAVPLSVGMVLSVLVGIGLGSVLQRLVGAPLLVNWTVIGISTGFAAGAVLLVNVLSVPSLWRLVRADELRTE